MEDGFFFRLLSQRVLKKGKDFYPILAIMQIGIAFYIFLFYEQMKAEDS